MEGASPTDNEYLFFGTLGETGVATVETVAHVRGYRTEYSAAVKAGRRWVAVSDAIFQPQALAKPAEGNVRRPSGISEDPRGALTYVLRVFYSDTALVWHESEHSPRTQRR